MQLRRALPLTLAALVTATGCVTVRPAGLPDVPRPVPAAVRAEPRQPTPLALPLGPLPAVSEPAPVAPEPERAPAPVPVPVPASAPQQPHRIGPARPAKPPKPARSAKPAVPAKPRKRPPAAAKSRPAAQRTYDMAPLCEAARGRVPPSIVGLCRQGVP
ncbi:hypothetical protein [Streptomyces sp. NBC_01233]|uniref:hypothetical protein n=1 Tax=Streptomyces sp. NBC_01233 TaxID=2903787 RepID=UPI002E160F73|nr:hypothetical protein OG332_04815 [Streptomyces sp. NBC_01233]